MATKLKNLDVTKVDFVDAGANQRADIKLFKRKDSVSGKSEEIPDSVTIPLSDSMLKRFFIAVGKKLGISTDLEDVQKKEEAYTFGEKMSEVRQQDIADEMWRICYALQSSLQSILYDGELAEEQVQSMMEESVSDFNNVIVSAIGSWSAGKCSEIRKSRTWGENDLAGMEAFRNRLDECIKKVKEKRGGLEEMLKIDKSKMTPEELAAYNDIIKKYAVEEDEEGNVEKKKVKPEENEDEIDDNVDGKSGKSKKGDTAKSISEGEGSGEELYKGLHPLVAAELESLKKFRENAETKELMDVAKKYEIIGKKPEELVPMLKSLRAAGGTAYKDMLSALDTAVEMVNASGVFGEIGKSGSYKGAAIIQSVAKSESEMKVEAIAKSYIEKDPSMSYTDAVAKAWENNPALMLAYENESGF